MEQPRKRERHRAVPLTPEVRFFAAEGIEMREADKSGDTITLTGSPIVYNADYSVRDMIGTFTERMSPGVASSVLGQCDCRFLFNHDGMPLARTLSGTLSLTDTASALTFGAQLDLRQSVARDLVIAIERGDVSQMSCGFIVAEDEWDDSMEDRTILRFADLLDVSAVTYPASPTTSIDVAKRMALAIPVESRARLRKLTVDLRAGKVLSQANQDKIISAVSTLHSVLDGAGMDPQDLIGQEQERDEPLTVEQSQDGSDGMQGTANPDISMDGSLRSAPVTAAERREQSMSFDDQRGIVYQALVDHLGALAEDKDGDIDIWIYDLGTDWVVWESWTEPAGLFRLSYALDGDAVSFTGSPEKVVERTSYEPVAEAESTSEEREAEAPAAPATSSRARVLRLELEARKRRRPAA